MLISDKERLEEIAENTYIHVHLDKETTAELPKHHFEYLYEQTERVTELEEEYQGIIDKATSERLDFLERQNKRYREALKEIATRKMSTFLTVRDMNVHFIKTAERALEGDD